MHRERQIIITAAGVTLGFLIAVQVRTLSRPFQAGTMRVPVLAERLLRAHEEIQKLRNEVEKLREKIREYEGWMAEGKTATEKLRSELERARLLAGLTQVQGPGIIVKLEDAPKTVWGVDPTLGVVHDTDLLVLVNELRAAGAEAIAINDQRVGALTAIRCVGPLITVNGVTISPPYEIAAIGDPDKLEKALLMPEGVVAQLRLMGILVTITPYDDLIIPALHVTPQTMFTRSVKEEG